MKKKFLFLSAIVLFNSAIGQIQNQQWFKKLNNPTENIQQVYQKKSSYINNLSGTNAISKKRLKKLARNEAFWKTRLGPDGTMRTGALMMKNAVSSRCNKSVGNKWQSLGLFDSPVGWVGFGKLQTVEVDPTNSNIMYVGCEGAGLFKTTNAGKSWVNLTDKLGYVALGVQDIAINPFNSDEIYFASGHGGYSGPYGYGLGIFHSIDGGNSWSRIDSDPSSVNMEEALCVRFAPFEKDQVFMGIGRKLYKLTNPANKDNISSWSMVASVPVGDMFRDIEFVRQNNSSKNYHVFAASQNVFNYANGRSILKAFYNSTTKVLGAFTNIAPNSNQGIMHYSLATTPDDPNALYVLYSYYFDIDASGEYTKQRVVLSKTIDGGGTYTSVYDNTFTSSLKSYGDVLRGFGRTLGYLEISPTNKNRMYISGFRISISTDGGQTWQLKNTNYHVDIRDIALVNSGGIESVITANDGGLSRSDDYQASWKEIFKQHPITEVFRMDVDQKSSRVIIGTLDNGTIMLDHDGVWKHSEGGDGGPCIFTGKPNEDYCYFQNGKGWTSSGNFIYSSNSGGTFSGYTFLQRYLQDKFNSDYIYFTHKDVGRFNLSNQSKIQSNVLTTVDAYIVGIDQSYTNANKLYAVSNNTNPNSYKGVVPDSLFFKSTNRGQSFVNKSSDPLFKKAIRWGASLTDVAVSPKNDEHVYVTLGGYKPNNEDNHRVFASANGGTNWTDITYNLPNAPASAIIIDKWTEIIYVGTDLGVYFLDQKHPTKHSTWQCFNNGMPPVIINQLKINYCTGKLIAGTFGKGVWQNDLPQSINNRYVITSNETWDYNHTRPENVVVANGATLNITNATIWIGGSKTITVEPGGKLIVNNSKLSHTCPGGLWGGIIVKGNAVASQEPNVNNGQYPSQGLVRLNNSTVEFARDAIRTYDPNTWVHQGGMVYAYNTIFRNNKRNAAFRIYENKNASGTIVDYRSGFKKCTFKVDANFPKTEKVGKQMVTLWRVRGIDFEGCKFLNETGLNYKIQGIYAHNADVLVYPFCSSGSSPCPQGSEVKSEFKKLYNGVVSTNHVFHYRTVVHKSNFEKNIRSSITLDGTNNAILTQNKIVMDTSHIAYSLGMNINNCTQFEISENQFIGRQEKITSAKLFGLLISNSGSQDNLVYKNKFQYLNMANAASGNNTDLQTPEKGLKYKCNVNYKNHHVDFNIQPLGIGIAKYQGSANNLPNNDFTDPSFILNPEGQFENVDLSGIPTIYTHGSNAGSLIMIPTKYTSNRVILNPVLSSGNAPQCISDLTFFLDKLRGRFRTNNGLVTVKGNYEQARGNYLNTKYIYGVTIDNGNTDGLISQIQSSVPSQMWNLRTDLINSSPLSDDVIINTINEDALNNTLLYEVLFKNPHLMRNEDVVNKLQSKKNPMPSYMLNVLLGKKGEISSKDQLLMKMSDYSSEAAKAAKYVIRHYTADSIYNEGDSLIAWLDKVSTAEGQWIKAGYYLERGDFVKAQQSLNGISTSELTKQELSQHNDISGFATFYKSKAQAGIKELVSQTTKDDLLQRIPNEKLKNRSFSKNWVRWIDQEVYEGNGNIVFSGGSNKRSSSNRRVFSSENDNSSVTIVPNPAKDYVNIQFDLEDTSYRFELIDNLGKVVRRRTLVGPKGSESIELIDLPTGIYHYRIFWKKELVTNGKISVIR